MFVILVSIRTLGKVFLYVFFFLAEIMNLNNELIGVMYDFEVKNMIFNLHYLLYFGYV